VTLLFDVQSYAYKILGALTSGDLKDGLRVSHLIDGNPKRVQDQIREALQLLERDGHIEVRDKGRGYPPARIFLRGHSTNG